MEPNSAPHHEDHPARLARDVLRMLRGQVDLSHIERLVLLVLADYADEEPSIADLGRATTCAPNTLAKHLKSLEAKGWISRVRKPPARTKYSIDAARIRQAASGAT